MLITTRTYLALQCQHCDKLFLHTLSRFDYGGQNARISFANVAVD